MCAVEHLAACYHIYCAAVWSQEKRSIFQAIADECYYNRIKFHDKILLQLVVVIQSFFILILHFFLNLNAQIVKTNEKIVTF